MQPPLRNAEEPTGVRTPGIDSIVEHYRRLRESGDTSGVVTLDQASAKIVLVSKPTYLDGSTPILTPVAEVHLWDQASDGRTIHEGPTTGPFEGPPTITYCTAALALSCLLALEGFRHSSVEGSEPDLAFMLDELD